VLRLAVLLLATGGLVAQSPVWKPALNTSWQWQLKKEIDLSVDAEVYDVDLFDVPASTVATLHARGRKVICYFSVGTFEPWRPDATQFPEAVKGRSLADFANERWLDIRRWDVLGPIMESRMDLCKSKGFDAIEPDNVDAYVNRSGFPLSARDQRDYNIHIAQAAHARGLSVGLKNDLDQIPDLVAYFDWALNEQCFQYRECGVYSEFIRAGKAVFHVEYNVKPEAFCTQANSMNFNSLHKRIDLDAYRVACRPRGVSAAPTVAAVVNAASYQGGGVAPGEIVAVFGARLGPERGVSGQLVGGRFATEAGDVTGVYFDGQKAPMLYAQEGQLLAVVPYGVIGKDSVEVVVERGGSRSAGVRVAVAGAAPALFAADASGRGPAAAFNQDGSLNSAARPARAGEIAVLYGTGEGAVIPLPADGSLNQEPLSKPLGSFSVSVGGAAAEVVYGGPAPGLVAGAVQVNVRVPALVRAGALAVRWAVDGVESPDGVTLFVSP
jgi:uncharacterized protein (TIGR03437 family)